MAQLFETFHIHNLVKVEVDRAFPWIDTWAEILSDVSAISDPDSPAPVTLRLDYTKPLSIAGMRDINDKCWICPDALVDRKYGIRLEVPEPGLISLKTDNPCLEWLYWGVNLALLAGGSVFVHAAGVAKNNVAVIFPSWGGVGKTALVTKLVQEMGWKLLGDDLVIITPEGKCWGFPKPMVLYPYHKGVFPEVFAKGKGPVAPVAMNNWLTKAAIGVKPLLRPFPNLLQFSREHNPQSVRINPSVVFGKDNLARSAKLKTSIWLDRVEGLTEAKFIAEEENMASRMMGSTLREQNPRCVLTTNIAMGLGIVDNDYFYNAWIKCLNNALDKGTAHSLYLPADLPVDDVPTVVCDILDRWIVKEES